ncbi:MAG: DUF4058 family protein [Cyanobacteria bacterium J06581_3]
MSAIPIFPGMNPYLESPTRWPEIHTWLIVEIARTLNPQLQPKYRAAVETRVYIDKTVVGIPDATVAKQDTEGTNVQIGSSTSVATVTKPERVVLPMPYEVTERYLEIRNVSNKQVTTVIELLSPANKRQGEGRRKYLEKRQTVLESATHFIEIDLLRKGDAMPMTGGRAADYHCLVSRFDERPVAEHYPFDLKENIPQFPVPLEKGDSEPILNLMLLLRNVCLETAIESDIDYAAQPQPPLTVEDYQWVQQLLDSQTGLDSAE